MIKNPSYSKLTKHVDKRKFRTAEEVKNGKLELEFVSGSDNPADGFTKPLLKGTLSKVENGFI